MQFIRTHAQSIGIAVAALIVVALGVYFTYPGIAQAPGPSTASSTASFTGATTTTQFITIGSTTVAVSGKGNFTVHAVPDTSSTPPTPPNYNAPIQYAASLSADARTAIAQHAAATRAQLAKTPGDINQWLAMGTIYTIAGDYANAEKIYLYVTQAWPKDPTAYNNLGDLYLSDLKDYPKAEQYYMEDIRLKPTDTNAYRQLFDMYVHDYKQGTSAAEDILKLGISVNANALDLKTLLARYYRDQGRTADAKAAYQAAIQTAQTLGDTQAVSELQAELSAL